MTFPTLRGQLSPSTLLWVETANGQNVRVEINQWLALVQRTAVEHAKSPDKKPKSLILYIGTDAIWAGLSDEYNTSQKDVYEVTP